MSNFSCTCAQKTLRLHAPLHGHLGALSPLAIIALFRDSGFRTKAAAYSGLGLYPTMGLLNHACDPALDVTFRGATALYRAFSSVRRGGRLTVDYGPIYYLQPRDMRQAQLTENYYFECDCEACVGDWPLLEEMEVKRPRFKCPECDAPFDGVRVESGGVGGAGGADGVGGVGGIGKATCEACGVVTDLAAAVASLAASHGRYAAAMGEARLGNVERAMHALTAHLALMQRVIRPPWRDVITCQAAIDQCFQMQRGGATQTPPNPEQPPL